MELYSIYGPAHHSHGTVHDIQEQALEEEYHDH